MTPTEAKQFWADLIAEDAGKALEIAKACPKVAGKWGGTLMMAAGEARHKPTWPPQYYATALRPLLSFDECQFCATVLGKTLGYFPTLAEAKSACDAKLRELGYLLEEA